MGGGHPPGRSRQVQGLEPFAPLAVGQLDQRAAVEIEQVEDREHDRHAALQPPDRRGAPDVHAALEALEAGPAVQVERHDLAVEHSLAHA
jgi:hypothetical protein